MEWSVVGHEVGERRERGRRVGGVRSVIKQAAAAAAYGGGSRERGRAVRFPN